MKDETKIRSFAEESNVHVRAIESDGPKAPCEIITVSLPYGLMDRVRALTDENNGVFESADELFADAIRSLTDNDYYLHKMKYREIDQSELEAVIDDFFEDELGLSNELIVKILSKKAIDHLRHYLSVDSPLKEAHVVFRNIPSRDDMFWIFEKGYRLKERVFKEILAFDEAAGMLDLERLDAEWEAEQALKRGEGNP